MRSEADIEDMKKLFAGTGDDSPAVNTAVRDTLGWVLGRISTEELIEEYCVLGADFQCFTCPAGVLGEDGVGSEGRADTPISIRREHRER